LQNVSLLSEAEVGSFSSTGDIADDILSIISVHPMREEKVAELIENRGEGFAIVETLIKESRINKVDYNGQVFYIRNFVSGGKNGK
jgi:wyosine [tRNA(Phe)-imidazoG37] synthetase (radical SAM superfamily)